MSVTASFESLYCLRPLQRCSRSDVTSATQSVRWPLPRRCLRQCVTTIVVTFASAMTNHARRMVLHSGPSTASSTKRLRSCARVTCNHSSSIQVDDREDPCSCVAPSDSEATSGKIWKMHVKNKYYRASSLSLIYCCTCIVTVVRVKNQSL